MTPAQFRSYVESPDGRAIQHRHGYHLAEVAPDVYASLEDTGTTVVIDLVECGDPGKGKVGAWLDSLANRKVLVRGVISDRFEGMLVRRGYRCINGSDGIWQHKPGLR